MFVQKKSNGSTVSENKLARRKDDEEQMQTSSIYSQSNTEQDDKSLWAQVRTYLKSYYFVELIVFFLIMCVLVGGSRFIPQYKRPLPYQITSSGEVTLDPSLAQAKPKSIISNKILGLTCFLIPFFIQFGVSLVKGDINDIHGTVCSYMFGFSTTLCLVRWIKCYTGVFRPTFYAGCDFDMQSLSCSADDYSNLHHSFPSGHAAVSFCGMTLFSQYFFRTFGVNKQETLNPKQLFQKRIVSVACLLPMIYAFFVSITRVRENNHFPADITAGACIGLGCAMVAFNMWFSSQSVMK